MCDKNYILQYYLDEFQAVMDQAVSRRNFTAATGDRIRASPSKSCGGGPGLNPGACMSFSVDKVTLLLSSETDGFPSLYRHEFSMLFTFIFNGTLNSKTKDEA